MSEQFIRRLGWVPDIPNPEHEYHLVGASAPALPGYYNARAVHPEGFQLVVEDQVMDYRSTGGGYVSTSSCTGNACSVLLEYEVRTRRKVAVNISRMATYALARKRRGWLGQDQGAVISDCFQQLASVGSCLESFHPFRPEYLYKDLDVYAYAQCARHRLTDIQRVRREDVKAVLAAGQLVVGGLSVCGKIWFQEARNNGGYVRLPVKGQDSMDGGGHAVCFTGFDQEGRYKQVTGGRPVIMFDNSWGTSWASNSPYHQGCGMFDEGYLFDDRLSDDFWTGKLLA